MTNLFRIGGVYRDGGGELFTLVACAGRDDVADSIAIGADIRYGLHRLSDGCFACLGDSESKFHLLPGELHQVDGQWVPVEEEKPVFLIERIEPIDGPFFVYDGEELRSVPFDLYGTPQEVVEAAQFLVALRGARNTAEPQRPALDWATAKPFDNFDGYQVTRSTNEQQACKSPLTTLGDGTDPAHASAFLKF